MANDKLKEKKGIHRIREIFDIGKYSKGDDGRIYLSDDNEYSFSFEEMEKMRRRVAHKLAFLEAARAEFFPDREYN